jgi:hypothetical protein
MRLYLKAAVWTVAAAAFLSVSPHQCDAFQTVSKFHINNHSAMMAAVRLDDEHHPATQQSTTSELSRRDVFSKAMAATVATTAGLWTANTAMSPPQPAHAVGPTKINLLNPTYTAVPCPKDRPIPGEKAMKGMRGLCVTVNVDLEEAPDKELEKVGVYGFITDQGTGESVLANNPDLSTDAGQFAMIESVKPTDKKIQFEFIAAVPREMVGLERRERASSLSTMLGFWKRISLHDADYSSFVFQFFFS